MCAVPVGHFFPFRPSFGTARGAPSLQSRFTQFAWPAQTSFPPGAPSKVSLLFCVKHFEKS
jgi:hypothetical protein